MTEMDRNNKGAGTKIQDGNQIRQQNHFAFNKNKKSITVNYLMLEGRYEN